MLRFSGALSLSTLTALVLTTGLAAAGDAKPPKDFTAFRPDNSSGEVLIQQRKDVTSARAALDDALDALSTYFDGRPRVLGAVADDNDTEIQAGFVAVHGRTVCSGMIVVHVGAGDAVVGVAYDEGKAFADDKAALLALLKKNLPEAATAPEMSWQTTRLPDGSGAIKLPKDWNVNAINAMVDVTGPDDQEAHFGLWMPVYTKAGAAYMESLGVSTVNLAVCDYTDPESALKVLLTNSGKVNGTNWKYKQRLGVAPAPFMPGKAAYLIYDADVTRNGKTVTLRSLVLIDLMPATAGQWTFYASGVGCPAETFDKNLPTLLEIWKSWKTDDRVFQARLKKAAEDMQATARIIQDANAYRQHVMDRANDDWSEVIRGTSQVFDRRFDTLSEVPTYNLKETLERLNEHEGYPRWKIIPLKDINNP